MPLTPSASDAGDGEQTPPADQTPAPQEEQTPPAEERLMSQAEVDRVVRERLARERAKYEGFDELKAKAARLDEIEEASRSDLEKAMARAEAAETEIASLRETAKEARLRAALIAEIAKADRKVVSPEDALQLLDKSTLELDEDGLPTNTAEAVDTLLEQKPFLVSQAGGAARGNADQGARQGGADQLTDADLKALHDAGDFAAIDKAHREGRLANVLRPS